MWHQEPGSILASYLVGEEEWTKEIERMKLEGQEASENGVQEITSELEEDEGPYVDDVQNSVILKSTILHFESHD